MQSIDSRDSERKNYVVYAKEFGREVPYSLNVNQMKMLLYVISKITYEDEASKVIHIDIGDMCHTCGISVEGGYNFKKAKENWKALSETEIRKVGENGLKTFSFFDSFEIPSGKNEANIVISANVAPYFFHQKGNYVQHVLEKTLSFTSAYSIRIYMLCQSYIWKEKIKLDQPQTFTVQVEQIRNILLLDKGYERWSNLSTRVIASSIAEINQKADDIYVEAEGIKDRKTKRVTEIRFTVQAPSPEQVELALIQRQEYFQRQKK